MTHRQATAWSAEVESLYQSQRRELWALFYAQCCDSDRAYEAVQESFLRLQQQNGAPIRDKRAWLLHVGRNWLRDVARRQRVAARSVDYLDNVSSRTPEPASIVIDEELQSRVRQALGRLQIEDREVLVLRYALCWPSQRIAETLNTTAAAVDMRLSRARKRLAEILKSTGVDHEPA